MSTYIKYAFVVICLLHITPVSAETQTISNEQTVAEFLQTLDRDANTTLDEQINQWVTSQSYTDLEQFKTILETQPDLTNNEQIVLKYANQKLSRKRLGLFGGASIVLIMFSLFITVLFVSNR